MQNPIQSPTPSSSDRRYEYAGFWVRSVASFIDGMILSILCLAFVLAVVYASPLLRSRFERPGDFAMVVQALIIAFYFGTSLAYYGISHARWGTTLGKRPFGVYVIDENTGKWLSPRRSLLRVVGYVFSYLPFGAGYLMAIFHPRKKALHDFLAGSVSVFSPTK